MRDYESFSLPTDRIIPYVESLGSKYTIVEGHDFKDTIVVQPMSQRDPTEVIQKQEGDGDEWLVSFIAYDHE